MYYKKTSSKQFVGIPMTGCCDGSRQYFILIGIDFLYQVGAASGLYYTLLVFLYFTQNWFNKIINNF